MKPKKFEKKLALKKKTIANLSNEKLGIIKGGIEEPSIDFCQLSVNSNCIRCTGTCQTCTCPTVAEAAQCCAPTIIETETCYCTNPGTPC